MRKFLMSLVFALVLVLTGCGGGEDIGAEDSSVEVDVASVQISGSDYVTIENVSYPLYPGVQLKQKVATLHIYKVEANAEEVFSWYSGKMAEEGWTIALDGSNGRTGQRTFQLGDPNLRPSLEFVIINVFQDGGNAIINITPQPNKYRN